MHNKEIFEKWAENYDEKLTRPSLDFPFISYIEVLNKVFELTAPQKGLKILDIGIGTALLASKLSSWNCSIYGIDFSQKMLDRAKLKIPNGKFILADIAKEHFGQLNNEKFDRIISNYFCHHLDMNQKIRFFELTIKNNLKIGGKIIIGDIGFNTIDEFNQAQIKYKAQWDENEFYLCGEEITSALDDVGIKTHYLQVSCHGGVLIYE
ncbi:class I SAM-dependent methyltransferase [bacterium]|nr:class I SAM-dependent methyltransferase [bacterium]